MTESLFDSRGRIVIHPEVSRSVDEVAMSCPHCQPFVMHDWFTAVHVWSDDDPKVVPYARRGSGFNEHYLYRCDRGHPFAHLISRDGRPWIRLVVLASDWAPETVGWAAQP